MSFLSQDQVNAALRYAGTAVGTIGTIAAVLGVMDADTAGKVVAATQAVIKDLTQTFGDVSKLVLLVMPIVTVWLARIGIHSASPASQRAAVAMQPHTVVVQAATADDTVTMANVIASIPEAKQVVSSPRVADATASNKVVAASDAKPVATTDVK